MVHKDSRRRGDLRPYRPTEAVSLTLLPAHGQPFRWLPRHGEPLCIGEWFSHMMIRVFASLPVYTAVFATLTLLVVLLGVPYLK